MRKILLLGILLCFFWDGKSQNKISKKDTDEIRALAGKRIQKSLPELMNTLNLDDVGEAERKNVTLNSFLPSNDQLFAGDFVIIEDDLNPDYKLTEKPIDLTVSKYFNNFDLFYKKSDSPTFEVRNVVVSEVKENDEQIYVKVFYTSVFKGGHKKIMTPYKSQERVAEFKAEKVDKKWEVLITRIAFNVTEKESVAQSVIPKDLTKEVKKEKEIPAQVVTSVVKTKEEIVITQQKVDEVKSSINPPIVLSPAEALELQALQVELSSYKSKKEFLTILSLGALGAAVGIFSLANSKYSEYSAKVYENNATYTRWHKAYLNGQAPPSNELAKTVSMSEYISPSFIPIGGAVVVGLGLFLWGNKYGRLRKETKAKIERLQKQTALTPMINMTDKTFGFSVCFKF